MKTINPRLAGLLVATLISIHATAGTITYVAIPPTNSDASSGIDSANVYTSAVDGGNASGVSRAINGVAFTALSGNGSGSTANNITLNALSGSLSNLEAAATGIGADGTLLEILKDATCNTGADNNSTQEVVLEPSSLTPGKTYDLRIYFCNGTGQNRLVKLSFCGDGQPADDTNVFNEDDATTSAGGFADANQVYYINYRFTWDGVTTPGVTITQKDGAAPFQLYALTNQEVTSAIQPTLDPVASNAESDVGVASNVFYTATSLKSHGRWADIEGYGNCWQPNDVSPDWRPYTDGSWAYSENDGYTWISNEDWGWATYHYGRWTRLEDRGWFWVPGRVWAPAWVSWRHGDSYAGWAPLPPVATFSFSYGISRWADSSYGIGPNYYNFVRARDFGSRSLAGVIISQDRNVNIIRETTNVTNIVNNSNTIYNGGPNIAGVNRLIRKAGGQPVPTILIDRRQSTDPLAAGGKLSQLNGNRLSLAAPTVIPTKQAASLQGLETIKSPKIDHGWNQVKDPKLATALKTKIARETKGMTPENTHAKLPAGVALKEGHSGLTGATEQPMTQGKHPGQPLQQPATAVQQPSPQGKHPGQPLQQPATAVEQPVTQGKHPGQSLQQPATAVQQPVTQSKHPGKSLQQPATAVEQPVTQGKHPGQPLQQPATAVQQPVTQGKHPGQSFQQPGTVVQQPAPQGKRSRQSLQQPGTAVQQPVTQGKHPGKSLQQPATAVQQPALQGKHPAQSLRQPATAVQQPMTQGKHPGKSLQQPATAVQQPAPQGKHPAQSLQQPGTASQQPAPAPSKKQPKQRGQLPTPEQQQQAGAVAAKHQQADAAAGRQQQAGAAAAKHQQADAAAAGKQKAPGKGKKAEQSPTPAPQ